MNAENIHKAKWHPIFGKDLEIGLEANMPMDSEFVYDSNLVTEKMIFLAPKLQPVLRKVHCPAVIMSNGTDNVARLKFMPCFSAKIITETKSGERREENAPVYFRIGLFGKTVPWKSRIVFARFGEDKAFSFNDLSKPYIYLDFFSKKGDQFIPVFAKILNIENGETVFLIIEGRFEDDRIELTIQKVSPTEVPPTLLDK